ncbi:MAG: indolepyruvate oxidoreductase subunit beta [Acidilobaceae archaeon]
MSNLNILIVGVGGQGILTLSRIIGESALRRGLKVLIAETHGLSQRGGSVIVHVRIGDDIEAPLIPIGECDLMLSLELVETLRYLNYMGNNGVIVSDTLILRPPIPRVKIPSYEEIITTLKNTGLEVHLLDASLEADRLGDIRVANMIILGYAISSTLLGKYIDIDSVVESLAHIPGKELNIKALSMGFKFGVKH